MRYLGTAIVLILLFSSLAQAGEIAPSLQERLRSAGRQEELPVIVTFAGKAKLGPFEKERKKERRAEIIRALKAKADQAQGPARAFLIGRGAAKVKPLWIINGLALTAPAEVIREVAQRPEVEAVTLDAALPIPRVVPAAVAPVEDNIAAVNAPALWSLGFTGQGVVVAAMDSGVDLDHPDLGPRWRGGTNSWFDPNGEHPDGPFDKDGHGTQVMGIVVGGDAGGSAIGVAPGARWIAVKIFNDVGEAPLSAIHTGFQWLLDPDDDPATDDAPDIVNNSWGLEGSEGQCVAEFRPDVQVLKAAGIAVAFSAGNAGPNPDTSLPPASYPESFAVGSVGTPLSPLEISSFSGRGPSACDGTIYPEVVAPGWSIRTADLTGGGVILNSYAIVDGTSYSTSHVSGVMALLLSAFPGASVGDLESAARLSAVDLGAAGPDNDYGYGLVDARAALDLLNTPPAAASLLSPADGATGLDLPVTLRWFQPRDADGDQVANFLLLATDPALSGAVPLPVAAAGGQSLFLVAAGSGFLLFGLLAGPGRRGRPWPAVLLLLGAFFLVSCGSDDSHHHVPPAGEERSVTLDASTLAGGTTYYWQIRSEDGKGGTAESEIWSFTTR